MTLPGGDYTSVVLNPITALALSKGGYEVAAKSLNAIEARKLHALIDEADMLATSAQFWQTMYFVKSVDILMIIPLLLVAIIFQPPVIWILTFVVLGKIIATGLGFILKTTFTKLRDERMVRLYQFLLDKTSPEEESI